ncbi:MAG: heparinase II/III family protein [Acinetobacter sp.]
MLKALPQSEQLFETRKNTTIQRLDAFSIDAHVISDFLKSLPDEEKERLICAADNAIKGRMLGFSSIPLNYGDPINWQLNPLTGKICDLRSKWFRIPDFDTERGDIKVIWEASRFTHFYLLSRAYLLTGDDKYYTAFSRQLSQWLKANPYSYGANYKCGQECALRLINGLMTYTVFKKAGVVSTFDEENIKELISHCYRRILSNFFYAYRCIKNNHTISELAGMIIGAWCCGDEGQVGRAYRLLNKVICEQFAADGGYTQFSFNYQRLALQDIECVMSLNTGYKLNAETVDRVRQSALLLYQCQSKSGDVPNYGSNDGALIFPTTSCDYRDYRPTVNCVYAMIAGTRLYPAGPYDEELLWFAGEIKKYKVAHLQQRSENYSDAGLFTIRNSSSLAMIVLNNYKSRPAHMDQLHLDLWFDGVNVLCDSGTYSYTGERGVTLAATGGHNNVKVASLEQMIKHGAFMLCGWTKREGVEWSADSFKGTMMSKNGYRHRREVVAVEDGYRITDEIEAEKQDGAVVDALFHTPCEVQWNDDGVTLSYQGKAICSIVSDGTEITVEPAERSLYYLKSDSIKLIQIRNKILDGKAKIETNIRKIGDEQDD